MTSTLNKGIPTEWLKEVINKPKEKEELERQLRSSDLLRKLKRIVLDREAIATNQETRQADYDNPSWAYKQADRNGYKRAIKELLDLLNFVEL